MYWISVSPCLSDQLLVNFTWNVNITVLHYNRFRGEKVGLHKDVANVSRIFYAIIAAFWRLRKCFRHHGFIGWWTKCFTRYRLIGCSTIFSRNCNVSLVDNHMLLIINIYWLIKTPSWDWTSSERLRTHEPALFQCGSSLCKWVLIRSNLFISLAIVAVFYNVPPTV